MPSNGLRRADFNLLCGIDLEVEVGATTARLRAVR
jgi:hypothetical protein